MEKRYCGEPTHVALALNVSSEPVGCGVALSVETAAEMQEVSEYEMLAVLSDAMVVPALRAPTVKL